MAALINRWLSKVIFLRNDDVELTNSIFYINQISSKLILLSKINTITCFCSRWTCSIDKRTNSAKKHFIIIKSLCGCARGIPVPQTSRGVTHRGVSATHPVRHSMPPCVTQLNAIYCVFAFASKFSLWIWFWSNEDNTNYLLFKC